MDSHTKDALQYAFKNCRNGDGPAKEHLLNLSRGYWGLLNLTEELASRLAGEITSPPTVNKVMSEKAIDRFLDYLPNASGYYPSELRPKPNSDSHPK